jgi:ATP-dependent helicase/DNAse subunit B
MQELKVLVELIEIKENTKGNYTLKTIYINPDQVVFLTENNLMKQQLQEGKINLGLNQNFTNFTNVRMNFQSHATRA